ncbi:hypothetical protein Dsin_006224 [Dipteronia sinensis]|uniref:Uncharacterized protein n=1 Tax=Dipteronia sinensis TaxID=43782 RepID=A0AAE0AZ72_9ROSI|nr:hypothetical protein Dsin_006224 [Dipteronia sinensis]
MVGRRRNKLDGIKKDDERWIIDIAEMKNEAVFYFVNLFEEKQSIESYTQQPSMFPHLEACDVDLLNSNISEQEIKQSLFNIGSFPKSRVFCSNNVSNSFAKNIADICCSPITKNLGKYLCVPLIHGRITKETYKEIFEKIQSRLATWKSATLSFAGKCTLINAVQSAILIYAIQSIKLPADICSKIDKLNKYFLWGHTADNRKVHLVNWKTVCLPKWKGGLGIKKSKLKNQALLAQAGWRLLNTENGLWGNMLKHKYTNDDVNGIFEHSYNIGCSSTWKGFTFEAKLLLEGLKWRVGDGCQIAF